MFRPVNVEYLPHSHHTKKHAPAAPLQLKRLFSVLMPALLAAVVGLVTLFVLLRPAHAVDCTVPGSHTTIQDAVDDASCTVVHVQAGTYVENVVINRDLEIYGAGAGSTVIDGDGAGTAVRIESGATVVISQTTIQNGSANYGGGIYNVGHLTLVGSEVRKNLVSFGGAGIYNASGATLVLEQSTVQFNELDGRIVHGAGIYNLGTMTVTGDSKVSNNTVLGSLSYGGGIYNSGTMTVTGGLKVESNTVSGSQARGGGIFNARDASLSAQDLTLSDNEIEGIISHGAGLNNQGDARLEGSLIANNVITGNVTTGRGSGIYNTGAFTGTSITVQDNLVVGTIANGGGLYNDSGEVLLVGGTFRDNSAKSYGGAVYNFGSLRTEETLYQYNSAVMGGGIYNSGVITATGAGINFNNGGGVLNDGGSFLGFEVSLLFNKGTTGGGLYNLESGVATLVRSLLILNEASNGGGAIFNDNNSSVTLVDSSFGLNSSSDGGGAIYSRGAMTLTRIAIYDNKALDYGAGIYQEDGQLLATNVTFTNNEAGDGGALYLNYGAQASLVHNTIFSNTVSGSGSGGIGVGEGAVLTMTGTIVGNNRNSNCDVDVDGSLNSDGYNLEDADDCGLDGEGDLVNTDPQLRPFASYGGYVGTLALLPTSPAIDAAASGAPLCPETDIRSVSRPVGAACDIGAYEILQLTIDDVEVHEDAGQVEFVISAGAAVPEPSLSPVGAEFKSSDGTAEAGLDYVPVSGTVHIPAGSITTTVVVDIIDDDIGELDETFYVILANATNALLVKDKGEALILDNDGPQIMFDDEVAVEEGDSGSTNVELIISLSASSPQTVSVAYATQDGTAIAGSDYVATSGTVQIAPGDTTATINVEVLGDTDVEPDETFKVVFSDASNGSLAGTEITVTILNDDDNGDGGDGGYRVLLPALYRP